MGVTWILGVCNWVTGGGGVCNCVTAYFVIKFKVLFFCNVLVV